MARLLEDKPGGVMASGALLEVVRNCYPMDGTAS